MPIFQALLNKEDKNHWQRQSDLIMNDSHY